MNYELLKYRQIFDALNNPPSGDTDTADLKSEITAESARILNALQHSVTEMDPKKGRQYIRQHQQAIHILTEELSDIYTTSLKNGTSKNSGKNNIEIFRTTLENLLLDLQNYFPGYFNHQLNLPQTMGEKAKAGIEQKTALLISQTSDPQTVGTLKEIINHIITEHSTISYQQKSFADFFIGALSTRLHQAPHPPESIDILLLIISLNFNHPRFYRYCVNYFMKEIARCEDLSAQYGTLNLISKSIKQTALLTGQKYNPDLPSIQESLLNYLSAELEYLSSMDKIGASLNHQGMLDSRYKVTLTVKQLAIFIHLQVEAKIIIAETPKLLHEYIAKHYSTNETDRISAKSFKNAYYSASTDDLEKVIDKIVTMLAVAQEKL